MKNTKKWLALLLAAFMFVTVGASFLTVNALTAEEVGALPGFVNDTDARITYVGNWGEGASRDWQTSAAGGGRAYTTGANDTATLSFTLTGSGTVQVVMTKQNGSGFVDISIDGGAPVQVNTNSGGTTQWAQTVYTSTELAAGNHKIQVKNADGGWGIGYIYLEGFVIDITGASTPFPGDDPTIAEIESSPYFVDERDPAIIYSSGWGKDPEGLVSNDEYAGGQRAYTGTGDSSAELYFKGDSLKLIMSVATADGTADLYIDGQFIKTLNTKATSIDDFNYNAVVYSTDSLDPGEVHSVKIVNTANNSWIYLIGFIVKEKLADPAKYAIERDPGFINDDDADVAYTGNWGEGDSRDVQEKAAGGGRAYTTEENAEAVCTFTGNEIKVVMTKQNGSGFVDISIDGGEPVRINTNSGGVTQWAQIVFEKKNLADGEHIVSVTNVSDGGNLGYVYLEGFVAAERTGPAMLDPREVEKLPGFINDNNQHIVYQGNWGHGEQEENGRYVNDDFAGGGCAYLGPVSEPKTGGALLTFKGTEISVIMERKSGNGYVAIYLDGKEVVNFDDPTGLWNTNTLGARDPNAVIFEKTGLDEGKHTIEVYSADGGYGYGWIYLAGFLTDGEAVAYEKIEPKPDPDSDPIVDPSDDPTDGGGAVPPTGSGLPSSMLALFGLSVPVLLATCRKKRVNQ